jgi:hypothetical protein
MIIFGGEHSLTFYNDVWVLSNANGLGGASTWTKLSVDEPSGSPSPRFGHSSVLDVAGNRMIVFGGAPAPSVWLGDVWVLSNANGLGGTPTWTYLWLDSDPSGPARRYLHAAVYDSATNRMTVFGGEGLGYTMFNDVWVLLNANGRGGATTWTNMVPGGSTPLGRIGHSAVYDTPTNRMIVFGGYSSALGYLNDVWVLSSASGLGGPPATWNLTIAQDWSGSPAWRFGHSAVYDEANRRMLVFGGFYTVTSRFYNDVWVLSHANELG